MGFVKAKKKPIVVDCVRWTGENRDDMLQFISVVNCRGEFWSATCGTASGCKEVRVFTIWMPNGTRVDADEGDWVLIGVNGEFYSLPQDTFEKSYDIVSVDDR